MAKKTKEVAPPSAAQSRFERLMGSAVVQKARGSYGALSCIPASQHPVLVNRYRMRSGIYSLDVALGGGWPVGRMSTTWGPPSTAKTTVLTMTIATAQQCCAVCQRWNPCGCPTPTETVAAFVDLEGTLDLDWAASQGVDLDRLLYCAPSSAEEALEITDGLVRSGDCDLVGYDSLALTVPRKTMEEREMGAALPGSQAKILSEGLARLTLSANAMGNSQGRRPTLLFLNQVRSQVGVVFGSPEIQSGGNAVKFMPSVIVRTAGGKVTLGKDEHGHEFPERAEWRATVQKNKTSAPRMEADAFVQLTTTAEARAGEFIDSHVMVEDAKRFGILTGGGGSYTLLGRKGSLSELKLALHNDKRYRREAYDTLMAFHFGKADAVEETADAPVEPGSTDEAPPK
jgi:recombination protein RecA